jgi:GTP-binding protein
MDYVLKCEKMHYLFVLVDSRLEPQKIDLRFIELLGENGIPFGIIFTKADKLSQAQLNRNIKNYKLSLLEQLEELPPMFISSSEKGTGREEILAFIEECLANNSEN